MRFDIRYGLRFSYDDPVWESHNEIRVRPQHSERQHLISSRLTTSPATRVLTFIDYWGTTVDHVGIRQRHSFFEVICEAVVDTVEPARTPPPSTIDVSEFLTASAHTGWTPAVRDAARDATRSAASVEDQARGVSAAVGVLLAYRPGSTEIGTTPDELLAGGVGVCQDFAHLSLSMLRSLAVPCRYVSGYLFAADETALDDLDGPTQVQVQTHAWIEAYCPDAGWLGLDPTNGTEAGTRHVVIGHGRDYDDVPPVVGVYSGAATPDVDAEAVITRIDELEHDSRRAADSVRPGLRTSATWTASQQQQQQ